MCLDHDSSASGTNKDTYNLHLVPTHHYQPLWGAFGLLHSWPMGMIAGRTSVPYQHSLGAETKQMGRIPEAHGAENRCHEGILLEAVAAPTQIKASELLSNKLLIALTSHSAHGQCVDSLCMTKLFSCSADHVMRTIGCGMSCTNLFLVTSLPKTSCRSRLILSLSTCFAFSFICRDQS